MHSFWSHLLSIQGIGCRLNLKKSIIPYYCDFLWSIEVFPTIDLMHMSMDDQKRTRIHGHEQMKTRKSAQLRQVFVVHSNERYSQISASLYVKRVEIST